MRAVHANTRGILMETNMASVSVAKKRTVAKKKTTAKVTIKKSTTQKRSRQAKVGKAAAIQRQISKPHKNAFEEKFGEGTAFDLDYGKLLIIGLCVYIAVQVS